MTKTSPVVILNEVKNLVCGLIFGYYFEFRASDFEFIEKWETRTNPVHPIIPTD